MKHLIEFTMMRTFGLFCLILIFSSCVTHRIRESENRSVEFEFKQIKAALFRMGSPEKEGGHRFDEALHDLQLTADFQIQTTPVTQYQWYSIMKINPSRFKQKKYCQTTFRQLDNESLCPNFPVERVSWLEVQEFITALNQSEEQYYYRLPTEAEWEYAARGGSSAAYSFGDDSSLLDQYGWYDEYRDEHSGTQTHPVKQKLPNAFGLYDMHGNVWEWVQDRYAVLPSFNVKDSKGPKLGSFRVIRGGSWSSTAEECRSASRKKWLSTNRNSDIGFRLVRIDRKH